MFVCAYFHICAELRKIGKSFPLTFSFENFTLCVEQNVNIEFLSRTKSFLVYQIKSEFTMFKLFDVGRYIPKRIVTVEVGRGLVIFRIL